MNRRFLALLLLASSLSVAAQARVYEPPNPPERVSSETKMAEVYEFEGVVYYSIPDDRVQYYVTKPGDPAHPFMVVNKIFSGGTDTRFEATGYGKEPESQAAQEFLQKVNDANAAKVEKLKAIEGAGGE